MAAALDAQLAELERERWVTLTGRTVPQVSTAMLRLALAWELQARALGGLPRSTQQRLAQLAAAKTVTRSARRACGWCANGTARFIS